MPDAYESDMEWLRYGQAVEFTTVSYPGSVFKGTIIVAQYLGYMEKILRARPISRGLTTAITALIIILLIYVGIEIWVIKPVNSLAFVAKK